MSKQRFYLKAILPGHIKSIHVEYTDGEIQSFEFGKPKKTESTISAPLNFDGSTVHTKITFAPVEEHKPNPHAKKNTLNIVN
jgi:hypothetical protein